MASTIDRKSIGKNIGNMIRPKTLPEGLPDIDPGSNTARRRLAETAVVAEGPPGRRVGRRGKQLAKKIAGI